LWTSTENNAEYWDAVKAFLSAQTTPAVQ
jgi:hypothetical protein